jgi:hypothetical protein
VADLPDAIGVGTRSSSSKNNNGKNSHTDSHTGSYADDSYVTVIGDNVAKAVAQLNVKAALFADWAKGNWLALNGGKSQFTMSSNAGNLDSVTVIVDGKEVAATPELELLGTVVDRQFLFLSQAKATLRAARQRALVIT